MRNAEIQRLQVYPSAPYDPQRARGVLLSDEIEFYCENYKLLDPYKPDNIMAASYELRVGSKYAIGKNVYDLSRGSKMKIR